MKRYVDGFMFDHFTEKVLLIQKTTPEWQAGMWNGIGGKIEEGEEPLDAMVREFREETTIETTPEEWEHVFTLGNDHWEVEFFRSRSDKVHEWLRAGGPSPTEEWVSLWDVSRIMVCPDKIRNLSWVIPLLRDPDLVGPFQIRHY